MTLREAKQTLKPYGIRIEDTNDMTHMEQTINRNLVTHAAQINIACPRCGHVLDVRSTVVFTLTGGAGDKTFTLCAKCFDEIKLAMRDLALQANGDIEVLDGRELFARARSNRRRK